jgi:hypothetical protein
VCIDPSSVICSARTCNKVGRPTRIVDGAVAHDAAEWDLLLHEVRRAAAAGLAELAGPHVVAPAASLIRSCVFRNILIIDLYVRTHRNEREHVCVWT